MIIFVQMLFLVFCLNKTKKGDSRKSEMKKKTHYAFILRRSNKAILFNENDFSFTQHTINTDW